MILDWRALGDTCTQATDRASYQYHDVLHAAPKSKPERLAKQRNFGMNDDAPSWIVSQLIEQLFHTKSVEEVYAQDKDIYELLIPLIREKMSTQQNLQQEVEQRIKRLEKSSENWEDLFFQVSQRLKEKYQLD